MHVPSYRIRSKMSRSLMLDSAFLQSAIGSQFHAQWKELFHYFPIPTKSVVERFDPEIRLALESALVCWPLLKDGADLGQKLLRVKLDVSHASRCFTHECM